MNNPGPSPANPPPGYVRVESKVEGITVYAPAPPVAPLTDARDFKCPNCGATTAYQPGTGAVTCSNCGSTFAIQAERVGTTAQELEFKRELFAPFDELAERAARGWGSTRRDVHCENCGATTSVAPTELATTCPFCGSNRVAARTAVADAFRPRFLIPFRMDRAQCAPLARAWLKRGWLYPRDLLNVAYNAQFTGIYLSFWTFHAKVNAQWRAEVGYERTERYFEVDRARFKTRTVIDWRWEQGKVTRLFENQLANATTHLPTSLLRRLEPFDLDALVTYDPGYLGGWRASSYEIALDQAWDGARGQMREETRLSAFDSIHSPHVRNFSMNAAFDDETWRLILLPVFIATYRFRDRTYQVVINGQTGKVAGDKPVAWLKVWALVALLVTPGLVTAGLSLLLRPDAGLVFFIGGIMFIAGALAAVFILQQAARAGEA